MAAPLVDRSNEIDDAQLVARLCEGDEGAFELLYERYFPRVYGFVDKRLRNRADTEETVQEVFINLIGSVGSYRGDAPFSSWLFGVARRTVAARFKKKRHPTVSLSGEEQESASAELGSSRVEPTPQELYELQERLAQMEQRIASDLNADQRQLFELRHVENYSIRKIATVLHKSEDAVKSNLYRARRILLAR